VIDVTDDDGLDDGGVAVFAALGDVNRQRLLDILVAEGATSAADLAGPLGISRQGVLKHLVVLERAGLVRADRHGRLVRYSVRTDELERSATRLQALATTWERRLAGIKASAEGGT
jgi:DNA-binding transcriptional ArsR family regulator